MKRALVVVELLVIVFIVFGIVAGFFMPRYRGPLRNESPPVSQKPPPPTKLVAPPDSLVHDPRILNAAATIILVRVIGFEMLNADENSIPGYATMLVLKSWRGAFSAGRVIHTPKGLVAYTGRVDTPGLYQFQFEDDGKEFLIMSNREIIEPDATMPALQRDGVWPAAESQALMAALDRAVVDR